MNEPIVLIDGLAQHFVASVQRINTHTACFRFSSLRGLFMCAHYLPARGRLLL